LVGGPDWPTSVLCGILKLSLFQCCIGTLPVIFVSTPCVVAGAFMVGAGGGAVKCRAAGYVEVLTEAQQATKDSWSMLSSTALMASAGVQLASMILATYFIQDVVSKHGTELGKPRKEHEKINALTRAEYETNQMFFEVINWHKLSKCKKFIILSSSFLFVTTCAGMFFMDEVFYREFKTDSRICDHFEYDGLDNDVSNLVLGPGYLANALFFTAVGFFWYFSKWAGRETKRRMAAKQKEQPAP